MTWTILAAIIAYIFVSRTFNILMGVFFWQHTEKEIWVEVDKDLWSAITFWLSPVLGDLLAAWNICCLVFYPLIWLTKSTFSFRTQTEEKKKRELRIEEKKKQVTEAREQLAEQILDKELKDLAAQRRAQAAQ